MGTTQRHHRGITSWQLNTRPIPSRSLANWWNTSSNEEKAKEEEQKQRDEAAALERLKLDLLIQQQSGKPIEGMIAPK